jgi:hypothetical protein
MPSKYNIYFNLCHLKEKKEEGENQTTTKEGKL